MPFLSYFIFHLLTLGFQFINRHKYAAIGGGVEPEDGSPLQAALREIYEETCLTEDSLRLLSAGEPYSFVDKSVNYEWSVHPFAFHWPADAREPLTLGWEHEGHAWFRPREIREQDVAGGVIESLRRVWPEGILGEKETLCRYCLGEAAGEKKEKATADARRDAGEAYDVFRTTVGELSVHECGEADEWRRLVRLAAWHVWNHADASIKAPLLAKLLPGLELVEMLLESQRDELAPEFERLAAMALENGTVPAEGDAKDLTRGADRFFSGLWKSSL